MKNWIQQNKTILGVLILFSPLYIVLAYYALTELALLQDIKVSILIVFSIVSNIIGLKLLLGK